MSENLFPPQWISGQVFEHWLNACDPHQCRDAHIEIHVPTECKILIQSALMMVSLLNQLASTGRHVILTFDAVGETYNYLNRMGFFDCLDSAVDVRPERPLVSGAAIYGGGNPRLVEIHALPPSNSQAVQGLLEGVKRFLPTGPVRQQAEAWATQYLVHKPGR